MKKRILCVDDDPAVLSLLAQRLRADGRFEILTATGGREGVREAARAAPHLVICDIDMPDLDGGSLAAALRADAATREIPILFLSNLVPAGTQERVGGWPMLSKAETASRLSREIERLTAEPVP
jgi:CheY-like chemotaxis protein